MRVRDNLFKMLGLCVVAGVLVAGVLFPVVGGVGVLSNQASASINGISAELEKVPPPLVTRVLDKDGNTIATLYSQYRLPVSSKQISPTMKAAIVAVEDKRFYEHAGVDLRGTLRAAIHDAGGGATQGASTITQQYVKNYLVNVVDRNNPLQQHKDQASTLARKLREAKIAMQLAQTMSKEQILTGYLNVVGFGGHVYGIGAASKVFFDTTPDKLTVPQAALLAGVVNNPNLYNPWLHPKHALDRRNLVIDRMVENHTLDRTAAQRAKKQPLGILPNPDLPSSTCIGAPAYAGFFCDYVRTYLRQAGLNLDPKTSPGGYTIKTTLDPKVAKAVKAAVDKNVQPKAPGLVNAFAVIQRGTKSHDVLAMVANHNYGVDASQGQTLTNVVALPMNQFGGGSSFKIFTAAASLEQGVAGLDTPLPNPPHACLLPPTTNQYTPCGSVSNLGHYPDPISLRDALATSPNVAFEMLEKKVGLNKVINMASRLGLRKTMRSNLHGRDPADYQGKGVAWSEPMLQSQRNNLSFTLGHTPVSPLEMANVVATIKSGGVWCPPNPIASVTDRNGKPVPIQSLPCEQVISPSVAGALMEGLSDDTVNGTSAVAAKAAGWKRPDIGKTGTTETNESLTFVGGVNQYAVASMLFAWGSKPEPICSGVPHTTAPGCSGTFGGDTAAPPYFQAFDTILAGTKTPPIPKADPAFLQANPHGPVVPYVVNGTIDVAKQTLAKAGYKVKIDHRPSTLDKGLVVGQSPQGLVGPGTTITLYVSSGKH